MKSVLIPQMLRLIRCLEFRCPLDCEHVYHIGNGPYIRGAKTLMTSWWHPTKIHTESAELRWSQRTRITGYHSTIHRLKTLVHFASENSLVSFSQCIQYLVNGSLLNNSAISEAVSTTLLSSFSARLVFFILKAFFSRCFCSLSHVSGQQLLVAESNVCTNPEIRGELKWSAKKDYNISTCYVNLGQKWQLLCLLG